MDNKQSYIGLFQEKYPPFPPIMLLILPLKEVVEDPNLIFKSLSLFMGNVKVKVPFC